MKTLTSLLSGAALILSTTFAPAANLLAPGLPIIGVAAAPGSSASAVAAVGTVANVNNYPAAEAPAAVIDGSTGTKYLNFAKVNTGLILTIPDGLTTVTGVQFNAANDAPERDPVTITIEGTIAVDPTTAAANATWTLLYSGASGLGTDPGRFAAGSSLAFLNSAAFNTYRVLVTGVRNSGSANSMQFSELQLLGKVADTTAPTIFSTVPTQGSVVRELRHVEVIFSEPVDGVNAADLLINGVPATNVDFGTPNQFIFDFPQPPTGTVTIAFAASSGIWDQAENPNPFAGASWTYTLDPNVAFFDVRINEIMADNQNGIRDENGDREDWIELYNAGSTSVNLAGWFLTDDTANPSKWRFPEGAQLLANGYLRLWASGKDRTNIGNLHTNFKLAPSGEFLGLVLPDSNTVVSSFAPAYPNQRADISYGRDRLDPSLVGFYATPTPGAANATSGGSGFASDVVFGRPSGTFVNAFSLELFTASPTAVIRYVLVTNFAQATATTTNVPTTNSPIYTGPIPITATTQVRARAFEPGLLPGTPLTESYVQISPNVLSFSSDVPVVVIHMLGKGSITANTTTESGILMAFDTNSFRSSLTNAPQVATRMGIHTRGSSTGGQAKSSLRVEFWDEFNQDDKHPFLGLPSDSDWVFYGINGFDPGLMHNSVFYWLGRTLGIASQRTRYVEVFRKIDNGPVTTNDYFGLYLLVETPKVSKDRLDITPIDDQDTNAPAITGGYIAKIDRVDNEKAFSPPQIGSIRSTPSQIAFTDPAYKNTETDPRRLKQTSYFENYILNFITNLDSASYTNPVTGYAKYIDPDQWVNNLLANMIPFNVDGYRLSGFIYKDRDDRLKQGPLWDCDRCLGTGGTATPQGDNRCFSPRYWRLPANDVGTDNGTDFFGVSNVGVSWFKRLFGDPDFWQRFIDRYQAARTNEISSNSIVAMVDGYYREIKEAQVREQDRWAPSGFNYPRAGVQTVNGYTFDFGPADNKSRGRFTNEVNFQKKWLLDRFDFMDTNFLNRPTLSSGTALVPSGTMVTVLPAAKANTLILYTLDGTDPRLPGGAVAPFARTNVGALTLTVTNSIRLFARSYNTSHANMTNSGTEVGKPLLNSFWSGPAAATYYTETPPLLLTELMFHPAKPPAGDTNDADNFEFIELKNNGPTTLNLGGFTLSGGINLTFSNFVLGAGQYCVVVKDTAAFRSRYGAAPVIAGSFAGNLANDGDHVVLRGPLQEPIFDFVYSDSWYPLTDSHGFSLVVQNENAFSNLSTNTSWRQSSVDGGSPGVANPPAGAQPGVVLVNEALTHTDPPPPTDTIELYNPGTNAVNIGGWWLTDNLDDPKKYEITAGTILPAGGYLLFDESQFNPTPGTNRSFALGSAGDQVYVFSGTNGFITGYYHGFNFGAAQNGRTFGRYVNSQTNEHFVAQAANTLGAANSLPLVGPIVISEIMYHPPETGAGGILTDNVADEFIELHNLSSTNVPLYHGLYPANTWKLSSAVDFTFPLNQSLPPNGFAVIVSFSPANSATLAAFRTKYGISASVPVYGPYDGKLDNSANSVRLSRPDSPNGLSVPQILVDRVDYADAAPWAPVADGFGASLQRLVPSRYGNDPTNWAAVRPTPGSLAEGGAAPQITQQPQNITVVEGMTTNLSVQVSSPSPVSYQWTFNSNSVPNGYGSTLVFNNILLSQAGSYAVAVFNGGGSVFSTSAVVTVLPLPVIVQQPTSQNVQPGTNFTISVLATGTGPLSYQWRFNGAAIPGATGSSLSYSNAQLDTHSGYYDVLITDNIGTRTSQAATLIVLVKPVITSQPVATTVLQGQAARFSVVAGPNHPLLPLYYRWLRNGALWASNTFPDLVITNCQSNGTFRVTVGNLAGTIGSTPAGGVALTVLRDFDGDGMADIWETNYPGFSTNNAADALLDFDGDGMINRDEFVAGTNPTDALSLLKIIVSATNASSLQFVAQTNIGYTVQSRTNLSSAVWNSISNITASPQVRTVAVDVVAPPGIGERYYRIVTPLVP